MGWDGVSGHVVLVSAILWLDHCQEEGVRCSPLSSTVVSEQTVEYVSHNDDK